MNIYSFLHAPNDVMARVIENALDAFVIIDKDSKVLIWTKRSQEMFGWSSEEALGQSITNLIIPPNLRQAHQEGMKRFLQTGENAVIGKRIEIFAQHRDGRVFPVELSITLIETEDGPIFSAALRDITERKTVEEQFRATFEQAAVGIAHIAPDGEILRANQKLCEILRYPQQELIHLTPQLLTHSEDKGIAIPHLRSLLSGNTKSSTYEKRYITKEGQTVWAKVTVSLQSEIGGKAKYFIVVVDEITESKRVHEQAERLAEVIEATSDFVSFASSAGEALYINREGRRMIGVPLNQELQGVRISEKYPPWAYQLVQKGIEYAIENGTWRGESALLSGSGQEIPVSQVIIVHKDRHGKAQYMSTIIRDMTERYETERALREADRRKDEFLAMLAHELRNPLAPISSAAELLLLASLDEARVKRASEIISRQIKHMTGLIEDLLDVSRVTRGLISLERKELDATIIVTSAIEQVRPLIEAREHRLTVELPPRQAFVRGDPKRLIQVMVNLLNNAAKYTPEGGKIRLSVEVQDNHVLFTVADTGIGMAPDTLNRAFDLFAQAERTPDRSQGGLGIGLALVKSLVELHGGNVMAFSEGIGKGSTFTVSLPHLDGKVRGSDYDKPVPLATASAKSLKVMVVDDNVDAADMLATLIAAIGHHVVVEHSSRKALDRAEVEAPDVFLLDIGLPDMDGNELARHLRARPETAKAKLVAVSGYGQARDRESAFDAGFDDHFVKPVDITKLTNLLNDITQSQKQ